MANIRRINDIEDDKEAEEREEFKENLSGDIVDIFKRVRNKNTKPIKKKKGFLITILVWLLLTGLVILAINFVLGNIWLVKFFVKNLFGWS